MSHADIEASRAQGRPINLFLMRYGSAADSIFAYTDAEKPIVHDGITYAPVAIQRGKIVVSGTLDKATLEVRLSRDSEVAELFLQYPPSDVINLIIRQGHLSNPDNEFLVGWTGRVVSSKRTDTEVVLYCEPVATSMKRVGLRRHYQYSCMHVLYGPQCRADKAAATVKKTVEAVGNSSLTLPIAWDVDPGRYIGGMIEWVDHAGNREYRTILRIASDRVLTLSGPPRGLAIGDMVDVVRGCPRTMGGCASHNNIHNFGGCPFIPKKNPIGAINQFY